MFKGVIPRETVQYVFLLKYDRSLGVERENVLLPRLPALANERKSTHKRSFVPVLLMITNQR